MFIAGLQSTVINIHQNKETRSIRRGRQLTACLNGRRCHVTMWSRAGLTRSWTTGAPRGKTAALCRRYSWQHHVAETGDECRVRARRLRATVINIYTIRHRRMWQSDSAYVATSCGTIATYSSTVCCEITDRESNCANSIFDHKPCAQTRVISAEYQTFRRVRLLVNQMRQLLQSSHNPCMQPLHKDFQPHAAFAAGTIIHQLGNDKRLRWLLLTTQIHHNNGRPLSDPFRTRLLHVGQFTLRSCLCSWYIKLSITLVNSDTITWLEETP